MSKMWQQLKTDIETAMAKKPAGECAGGQYKRFSVIRSKVGAVTAGVVPDIILLYRI